MKTSRLVAALLVGTALVGGAIYLAGSGSKTGTVVRPSPVDASALPPEIFGAGLEPGFTTFAWYSYTTNATTEVNGVKISGTQKWWIRVDRGPTDEGTVLDDVPWRWTIFVDKPAPVGNVPIATKQISFTDLSPSVFSWTNPVPESIWREYSDNGMSDMVAAAAGEQIDTMVGAA